MSRIGSGILEVGTRADPVVIGAGLTVTVTTNANKEPKYFLIFDDEGSLLASFVPHLDVHCHIIDGNSFTIHNDSGSQVAVKVLAIYEFFSPGVSGFIPASDVV